MFRRSKKIDIKVRKAYREKKKKKRISLKEQLEV